MHGEVSHLGSLGWPTHTNRTRPLTRGRGCGCVERLAQGGATLLFGRVVTRMTLRLRGGAAGVIPVRAVANALLRHRRVSFAKIVES